MIKNLAYILVILFINISIFFFLRLFLSLHFSQEEIFRILVYGIGSDLRIICVFVIPYVIFVLINFVLEIFKNQNLKRNKIIDKISVVYATIISLISLLSAICNYYYFNTFNTRFNAQVFELFNDETIVILNYIFAEYPVIILFLFFILFAILFYYFFTFCKERICRLNITIRPYKTTIIFIIFIISFVWGIRGFDTFPRQSRFTYYFSTSIIANEISVNPLLALTWANKERKEKINFIPLSQDELITFKELKNNLFKKTAKNDFLEKEPPNILFVLLESFGTNLLLDANKANIDILGSFKEHFISGLNGKYFINDFNNTTLNDNFIDFTFLRFLGGYGTMPSLQEIYLNAKLPVSHLNSFLKYSSIDIYKNAGYKIIFVTNGSKAWKNINAILEKQGVDEIYDVHDIMNNFPNATKQGYGTKDEFLYKMILRILNENKNAKKPLFIFALSTENHPPFYAPLREFKGNVLEVQDKTNLDANTLLSSYYSANDEFGKFILKIKSDFDNLIVAASGDHHVRDMKNNLELIHDFGVPFYITIPRKYTTFLDIDNSVVLSPASLKDIMPTLYNLSLSNATYLRLGRNLFDYNEKCKIGIENNHFVAEIGLSYGKGEWREWKNSIFSGEEIKPDEQILKCIEQTELLDELSFRARIFNKID